MNLSYLYLKKILEEELRDHDCQCQLNPDFTVTISCRVDGPHGALYIVPNSDFLKSSSFSDLSAFILNLREEIRRFGEFEAEPRPAPAEPLPFFPPAVRAAGSVPAWCPVHGYAPPC